MATVIDALFVELGIDASQFTKGQKDAIEAFKKTGDEAARTAKEMEARGKQAAQFFRSVKNELIAMLAVFTAGSGLESFVSKITKSDAALALLAKNVGMTVEALSTWQNVAAASGGTAQGMASSIEGISRSVQEFWLTGQTKMLPFLQAAGVDMAKFMDKSTSMNDRLLMLADSFSKMDPAKAQALGANLGLDTGTITTLMQGREALARLYAEQSKYASLKDDTDAAQRRAKAFGDLERSANKLGQQLLTQLSPAIEWMTKKLTEFSDWATKHPDMVQAAFLGIAAAATALGVAMLLPYAGILLFAGAIALAIGAISLLYDDWQAWLKGGESKFGGFWQYISDHFGDLPDIVGGVVDSALDLFESLWDAIGFGLDFVASLFSGNADDIRKSWSDLLDNLSKLGDKWLDYVKKIFELIKEAVIAAFKAAFDWIAGRAGVVWDLITGKKSEKKEEEKSQPKEEAKTEETEKQGQNAENKRKSWREKWHDFKASMASGPSKTGEEKKAEKPDVKGFANQVATLIARGEGDYNSVNLGEKGGYKAAKVDLPSMTVAEVMQAQKDKKFNAAGRYQIIGSTLKEAVQSMGLKGDEKFDQAMQDRIFNEHLIGAKRKAIGDYINGKSNNINAALLAASQEWASVADPRTGKSYYDGKGNNHSSITAEEMAKALNAARASATASGAMATRANTPVPAAAPSTASAAPQAVVQPGSTSKTDVQIGAIHVHTAATDAKGIASGIGPAVKERAFVDQANYGVS